MSPTAKFYLLLQLDDCYVITGHNIIVIEALVASASARLVVAGALVTFKWLHFSYRDRVPAVAVVVFFVAKNTVGG